jgi:hypothetical protein
MEKLDVIKEIKELKTQLAYSKNMGFFFGAGTSCALKIPNIDMLTEEIEKELTGQFKDHFSIVRDDLKPTITKPNIEDILNQVRRIREITSDNKDKDYMKVSGEAAKKLDKEICKQIYDIITASEEKADLTTPTRFFAWLNILNREHPKEIFTTNYDLIIERSLEVSQIPYFDGFVGSYEPFFWQESIDQLVGRADVTRNWIRLWKIHGSLSWFWKVDALNNSQKIVRVGKFDKASHPDQELVIYPSKEKYDSSRKQPFIAYFDRLQNYLLSGELLFIFTGYSFSDQHINDVIFNCLRQNQRLFCVVFFYKDTEVEALHRMASSYMNLNVFGPTKALFNGKLHEWEFNKPDPKDNEKFEIYFDDKTNKLKLGDFAELANFLISSSGKADLLAVAKP